MKIPTFLLLALLGLNLPNAFAKDMKYPKKGEARLTVTIPDSWDPEHDDDGTIEAEDDDENAYIAIWEQDTFSGLEKVAEDIDEILSEYAEDVKIAGKPEPYDKLGAPGLLIRGTAKDQEDDSKIGFEAIVVPVSKNTSIVIYFDYAEDSPDSVVKSLVKILESIRLVK